MPGANPNDHVTFAGGDLEDDLPDSDESVGSSSPPPPPKPPSSPPPPIMNLTPKFKAKQLRGNLMREQRDRDPLFYYEVITVLGVGSMGSVAKVKKRTSALGGSARKDIQDHFRREKKVKECFSLPLVGGFFQFCLQRFYKSPNDTSELRRSGSTSSFLRVSNASSVEDYNDLHGEPSDDYVLAMKSIHLSRVTDAAFVDELKNEIHILRTLDHPHIVRAIETFEHRNQIFIVMVRRYLSRLLQAVSCCCTRRLLLVCVCDSLSQTL